MKKLQIKTADGWRWVFCRNISTGRVQTTPEKRQALPSLAIWGADDMAYFQRLHAGDVFRLAASLEG